MVAAYYFGINGKINAFTVAFQIPNLVRALLADAALSGAFVPVFSDLIEKGDRKRAWRVASTIFWLVLLVLGGLTALFILIAPLLIRPFGDPGGDFDLAVGLSRVLFPIVVLLGLSGVIVGILNTYDHFTVPALTPVFWNLAIIAGLVARRAACRRARTRSSTSTPARSWSATLIQLFLPVPWLRGLDGRLQLVLDWRDPAVRRFFTLMLPVTLTLGLINVNAVIDTLFASRLIDPDLAPAAINSAFRLYMLPQGMFSVAVATVLFPALARLAARNDLDGFRATVSTGLRQIGFLLIPAVDHLGRPRDADRAARLRARRVHRERRDGRRRLSRGVLARARLQRLDADDDARLLRPAVELAADRDRRRHARPQRRARRRPLPRRRSGGSRSRRRSSTSSVPACSSSSCGGVSVGSTSRASPTRSCASPSPRSCSARSPSGSGTRSTTRSAARPSRRSCRSAPHSASARLAYLGACRLLRVRELDALRQTVSRRSV